MAELVWDALDERFFETGCDHGILFTPVDGVYSSGVVWNGLTAVTKSPSGAEASPVWADNIKYLNMVSAEEFSATIEAIAFPKEFLVHNGVKTSTNGMQIGQQGRPPFGFYWRTNKGNANDPEAGYIHHFAYGLQAAPSEAAYNTVNDSPEPTPFSWTVSSTPVPVTGSKPTAIIEIDSTDSRVTDTGLAALLEVVYGSGATPARLPLPDEIDTLLATVDTP